jgi:hypothetical protein
LEGVVKGVIPAYHRVAVFIFVGNGWWNKPTWDNPLTPLQCDGSFVTDITTGGDDQRATKVLAYVVPASYKPPALGGSPTIPPSVEQHAVAWIEVTR